MTSLQQEVDEELVMKVTGKAAEYVAELLKILKQGRAYIEAKVLERNLPFSICSNLNPRKLTLVIQAVPTEDFYETVRKEREKLARTERKELEQEIQTSTNE